MVKRIITGAILIPAVVALVYLGPSWLVAIVAAVVALLAVKEFFKLTSQVGMRAFSIWTMVCTVILFYSQWLAGNAELHRLGSGTEIITNVRFGVYLSNEAVFLVFLFGAALMGTASRVSIADVLPAIAASSAALIFVAWPFSYLIRMDGRLPEGPVLVLFALAVVWAGDTLAYFTGKSMGRVKMAPALSPGKTWEGAVGNIIGSLVVGYFFARWQNGGLTAWLATAALANIAGQVGDLVESAYKRGAGVKDSGAMLPGHGGMLDRIDSLIFAAPVVWLAAGWLLPGRM
ncbi:MAG TPA: phosphatidate cytidylyltransferase [Candidatus Acidoferrales bacterium]|nr:phosphatidate cytidylyltransferase [Candidatus Acidoferrales bacterium]